LSPSYKPPFNNKILYDCKKVFAILKKSPPRLAGSLLNVDVFLCLKQQQAQDILKMSQMQFQRVNSENGVHFLILKSDGIGMDDLTTRCLRPGKVLP